MLNCLRCRVRPGATFNGYRRMPTGSCMARTRGNAIAASAVKTTTALPRQQRPIALTAAIPRLNLTGRPALAINDDRRLTMITMP